jgi:hypothetical protein
MLLEGAIQDYEDAFNAVDDSGNGTIGMYIECGGPDPRGGGVFNAVDDSGNRTISAYCLLSEKLTHFAPFGWEQLRQQDHR